MKTGKISLLGAIALSLGLLQGCSSQDGGDSSFDPIVLGVVGIPMAIFAASMAQ